MKYDIHYQLISKIYEGKHAERSGVPYMNHINEGLMICDLMNFSLPTKQAYCLHPLFQNDKDLAETFKTQIIYKIGVRALALVMEYRNKANSYLSNKTDCFVSLFGFLSFFESFSYCTFSSYFTVLCGVQDEKDESS